MILLADTLISSHYPKVIMSITSTPKRTIQKYNTADYTRTLTSICRWFRLEMDSVRWPFAISRDLISLQGGVDGKKAQKRCELSKETVGSIFKKAHRYPDIVKLTHTHIHTHIYIYMHTNTFIYIYIYTPLWSNTSCELTDTARSIHSWGCKR